MRRWFGVLAAACILVLAVAWWATRRPALSPTDVQVTAVLRSPDQEDSLPWMKDWWKLDITVNVKDAAAHAYLQRAATTVFDSIYPYEPYVKFELVQRQVFRDAPIAAIAGDALRANGLLAIGDSAQGVLDSAGVWAYTPRPGTRYPIYVTYYVQPQDLPRLWSGVVVYVHSETWMGRDLSWWKSFPIRVGSSASYPVTLHGPRLHIRSGDA